MAFISLIMRLSKYAILVFLFFSVKSVFSQTVTVTSKEDSGPGTLRAALSAIPADRAVPYIINFNIPGAAANDGDRTIRLRSALPLIPSNVVIDASTQNWSKLGISGAKVIIEPESPNTTFSGLVIGQYSNLSVPVTNVEVYGLYLRDFAKITDLRNVNTNQGSGIVVDYRAGNIKIGAPGKGNVISGNLNGIVIQNPYYYDFTAVSPISILSNIIGLNYDGTTAKPNVTGISANLYDSALNIGGDNNGDGNVVSANQNNIVVSRQNYNSNNRFEINIVNNKIGTDYRGSIDYKSLPLFQTSSSTEFSGVKINAQNTQLYMRNNVVSGNRTVGISISYANFILTGNKVGTGVLGTELLKNGVGIKIDTGGEGTIGGATSGEANTIANNDFGIELLSSKPVKITRNSMYCNKIFGIGETRDIAQPYVQVLVKRPNFISGKATPSSEVELFYTSSCEGNCEGREYFATVQTGTDGRWQANVPANRNVTATASLLSLTTSPFSTAALLPNEAIIDPVTCNGNGSIKVLEPREGMIFTWRKILSDGTAVPLGNAQQILNLEVGSYQLSINDGCKTVVHPLFEIKDQKLGIPVITVPPANCGQLSFSFSAAVNKGKGTISYEWYKAGVLVGRGAQINLPEGTYTVKAKDEAGCETTSLPVTISRKPQPKITTTNARITDASCGQNNGAIEGITIDDPTGTPTYKWFKYDERGIIIPTVVSTNLNLTGVEGGAYVLEVRDAGACSPVSAPFYIPIRNTVAISRGAIRNTTCGADNGTISNVFLSESDQYEWIYPDGTSSGKKSYTNGTELKLENLKTGTYKLIASLTNATCTATSLFEVLATPPTQYIFTQNVNPATCGRNNGSIVLTFNRTSAMPVRFEWRDASSSVIPGSVNELKDLGPGTYYLFVFDANNCPQTIGPFVINNTPVLVIEPSSGTVADDGCSLLRGSVKGVRINGGIPPYNYTWQNEAGALVQSTLDLIGVPEGRYKLTVRDQTSCGLAVSEVFTIANPSFVIPAPVVNDLRVCYATEIMLPVMAPEEGTYQLFQKEEDLNPIMESTTGRFIFKVSKTADYYIRRKLGSCYSVFTKVHLEVTNDNLEIKNTMTPNGDGMNDFWMISGLPENVNVDIKLYTRSGQLVYESLGKYDKPFDGRFRGQDLPAGAYYYKIDLRADCKPIGGSLTLLR